MPHGAARKRGKTVGEVPLHEEYCYRVQHPSAMGYWETGVEFDYVRENGKQAVVSRLDG